MTRLDFRDGLPSVAAVHTFAVHTSAGLPFHTYAAVPKCKNWVCIKLGWKTDG